MNRIENIVGLVKNDALPARRAIYVDEVLQIRELAMKAAEKNKEQRSN